MSSFGYMFLKSASNLEKINNLTLLLGIYTVVIVAEFFASNFQLILYQMRCTLIAATIYINKIKNRTKKLLL